MAARALRNAAQTRPLVTGRRQRSLERFGVIGELGGVHQVGAQF